MDDRTIGGGRMMTSWAARMHRGAASVGAVVTSCGHPTAPYPRRIEKVKFGAPVHEVCKNDIPGPLLILILKLNKEAPYKKDVFRAPGHQGNMKKLIHFLQNGRLVNIDNFSVYTIASVLKKFLRKIPDGIFGREGEQQLFEIIEMTSVESQRDHVHTLISSLPICTQRLIVLLFGTFRVVASNCERSQTGMTSEALGVSVAPSFFQSCVSDGKTAKMEDVMKFKVATKIMKFLIDNFGVSNLFGRDNYEYYARITGRILRVEEDWIFSFRYPPDELVSRQVSLAAEKTWLQFESQRWGLKFNLEAISQQDECHSTPALIQAMELERLQRLEQERERAAKEEANNSLNSIPENTLLESCTRLSISLEHNGVFQVASVPERQAARMKMRSEWFLSSSPCPAAFSSVDVDRSSAATVTTPACYVLREETGNLDGAAGGSGAAFPDTTSSDNAAAAAAITTFFSSQESLKHPLVRRSSSKERRLVRRSSSKKNKENGTSSSSSSAGSRKSGASTPGESGNVSNYNSVSLPSSPAHGHGASSEGGGGGCVVVVVGEACSPEQGSSKATHPTPPESGYPLVSEAECTETNVQTFHVTLTYKPRI